MTKTIEERLQALEDKAAIAQLRADYCHVLDHRDWDAVAAMFTEDGEFDGLAHARNRAEIHHFFSTTVQNLAEGFWHFCTNPTIHLNGDTATGRISMQYLSLKNGKSYVSAGHYDDDFRREGDAWKFRKRKITFYYYAPLEDGFTGKPTYIDIHGTPRVPQTA